MSVDTWPASLNTYMATGWSEILGQGFQSFRVSKGPEKRRYTHDNAKRTRQTTVEMNGTKYQALKTFYVETLANGTEPFDWTNPIDDTTERYRFARPITSRLIIGSSTPANRVYQVTLVLEVI